MKEMEEGIRECYAETINLKSEIFWEIILLDAAFIIEVLLRYRFHHLRTPNDYIFRKLWMIRDIRHDLLLLEIQLPLFVLQDLFEMTNMHVAFQFSQNETLLNLFIYRTLNWFMPYLEIQELPVPEHINPSEIKHILDFLRICLMPKQSSQPPEEKKPSKVKQYIVSLRSFIQKQSSQQNKRKFGIPSATELHEAGVKFKVSSSKNLFDIKFSGNILAIPHIRIVDQTERFGDYTMIMDYLINTSKDVELLVQAKITENCLSDNSDVSNLFNGLSKEVNVNIEEYYFTKLHEELNHYCEIPSHKWKATLRQDYCNTPWRVLSITVAAILLGLTFIQSLCSPVSCNK